MSKATPNFIITVNSKGRNDRIRTFAVHDQKTGKDWTQEQITARGIGWFRNLDDLKETLNWNLSGDSSKYRFKWIITTGTGSYGLAFVFD